MPVKQVLQSLLPAWLVRIRRACSARAAVRRYRGLPVEAVFTRVYAESAWGRGQADFPFNSGAGSHEPALVDGYVTAVRGFLSALGRPAVVDFGCGDFNVGARLRDCCGAFSAVDVVKPLIAANRARFRALNVEFLAADMLVDDLPEADVALVRQVFQHLSNGQVAAAIARLVRRYAWIIVTEHLPADMQFMPNMDISPGPGTRLQLHSGVVLTATPFALRPLESRTLCECVVDDGVIRTIAYRFPPL